MLKQRFSFVYFILLIGILLLSITTPAQTGIDRGVNSVKIKYTAPVATTAATNSDWFSIADYLSHSLYTYPTFYTKIQSSALSKPHITVTLIGSNDQVNEVIVDTVGTVGDSLETVYNGNTNLNNKKFWYYKLRYKGESLNPADAILRTDLIFIKPQP